MDSQNTTIANSRAPSRHVQTGISDQSAGATRTNHIRPGRFDSILTKQRGGITSHPSNSDDKQSRIRHATEQLVATALVKPLLQQARDTPLDANLIDGGQGEKAFGKKLDTIFADRIVSGSNFPVVKAINDRLSQRYEHTDKPYPGTNQQIDLAG